MDDKAVSRQVAQLAAPPSAADTKLGCEVPIKVPPDSVDHSDAAHAEFFFVL